MQKRMISLLVVFALILIAMCGCAKTIKPEDIAKAPYEKVVEAVNKTLSLHSGSYDDPLYEAKKTAQKGAFDIRVVTQTGEKVTVTVSQDAATQQYMTTWRNNATGNGWSSIIKDGVFGVQPSPQSSWYSIGLDAFDENIKKSNLSEALNQPDDAIINRIKNKYRAIIAQTKSAGEANLANAFADILLGAIKDAEASVKSGWAQSAGEMKDAIIVSFSMPPDKMYGFVSDIMAVFEQEQYGYDAYLDNLLRECMSQAGCEFYDIEKVSNTTAEKLLDAGEQLLRFYENADCQTRLMIALSPESGNVINIACIEQDVVEKETVVFSFNLALDDNYEHGSSGVLSMYMDGQETCYSDFNIDIQYKIRESVGKFIDDTSISYRSKTTTWKTANVFTCDKTSGRYEMQTSFNDQDLSLKGSIMTAPDGLNLSLDNVAFAELDPIAIDVTVQTASISWPNQFPPFIEICGMNSVQTEAFIAEFAKTMPQIIFGNWEPWEKVDLSIYEKFIPGYDYDKNGVVDDNDKAYFEHMHSILETLKPV